MANADGTADATCVLCAISAGDLPATQIFADEKVLAITPLRMMTPVHVLLFPRQHFDDLPTMLRSAPDLAGQLMSVADTLATGNGLATTGYRLAWNYGPDTAQTIFHPHLHLLGGRPLDGALG